MIHVGVPREEDKARHSGSWPCGGFTRLVNCAAAQVMCPVNQINILQGIRSLRAILLVEVKSKFLRAEQGKLEPGRSPYVMTRVAGRV